MKFLIEGNAQAKFCQCARGFARRQNMIYDNFLPSSSSLVYKNNKSTGKLFTTHMVFFIVYSHRARGKF